MIKLVDITKSSKSFYCGKKCAEIFFQNMDNFSIVCLGCGMKTFEFNDFLLHFHNIHQVLNDVKSNDEILTSPHVKYCSDVEDQECYDEIIPPIIQIKAVGKEDDDVSQKSEMEADNAWSPTSAEFSDDQYDGDDDIGKINKKQKAKITDKMEQTDITLCCTYCKKIYKLQKCFEQHIERCQSGNPIAKPRINKCASCKEEFRKKSDLDAHIYEEHGGFGCDQCDRVYKNREDLELHHLIHSGERNYKCDLDDCGKAFFNRKYLTRHKRSVHRKSENYRCKICGYSTQDKASFVQHKYTHPEEKGQRKESTIKKDHKCDNCEEKFVRKYDLDVHIKDVHGGFCCDQCDRLYKNREDLQLHQLSHSGKRSYICDIDNCRKAFFNRKYLTRHKRLVHTDELNYCCEFCGYRTRIKAVLIRHNRTHTGEKPFACETCGKCFASRALVANHRPIHSEERPFKCEVCGAAFARYKTLVQHKYIHSDVKQFVCKLCGKAFAQSSSRAGHMRQHKAEWKV